MTSVKNLVIKAVATFISIALVSAAPNVTVVPLGDSCASYPNYDNTTGIAGPLRVVADSTGKDLDGRKFSPIFAIAVGGGSWGFMVIPAAEDQTKKTTDEEGTPFRCGNNTLQAHLNAGSAGDRWQPLIAAGTPAESAFGFGLPDLPDPNYHLETWLVLYQSSERNSPYSHIVDGAVQPGAVFLGAVNITSWGFNYQNNTGGEYYYARLLGPNSNNLATGKPLNRGEFTGYIKITAA
ncbi:uncharacterized protein F4822DRAFT_440813 [Hypoxylon trugodes]|uniref:uncharacterized protein n=1 Tax=Hypoxylon trugodes TaxID=326681 RepID=UPI0021A21FAF|nr:uncharacterized protein F4822DRAFT_440813 [Hypoxylon trugodes]KAI1382740.1 hypothetical protein F4822DRAFT_440813 [Hypoxylon trugodes]